MMRQALAWAFVLALLQSPATAAESADFLAALAPSAIASPADAPARLILVRGGRNFSGPRSDFGRSSPSSRDSGSRRSSSRGPNPGDAPRRQPRDPGNGPRRPRQPRDPGDGPRQPRQPRNPGDGQKPPHQPKDPGQRPPKRPNPGRGRGGDVPAPRPPVGHKRPSPVGGRRPGDGQGGDRRLPKRPMPLPQGRVIDRTRRPDDALRGHPTTGEDGRAYKPWRNDHGRVIAPSREHIKIVNDKTVINNITVIQNNWNGGNGYGWYNVGGHRVGHRYWGGFHWWGWYIGDYYFWAPYYAGYWWWWDPYWHRWCWMHNGYWWYQDGPVIYVYNDASGTYSRYDDGNGGEVAVPDTTPPEDAPPPADETPDQNAKSFYSADGTRVVEVSDADDAKGRAYLYYLTEDDGSAAQALKDGVWLGDGVTDVRFQNDQDGKLTGILTLYTDDQGQPSFNLFDQDGGNLNRSPALRQDGWNAPAIGPARARSQTFRALEPMGSGALSW